MNFIGSYLSTCTVIFLHVRVFRSICRRFGQVKNLLKGLYTPFGQPYYVRSEWCLKIICIVQNQLNATICKMTHTQMCGHVTKMYLNSVREVTRNFSLKNKSLIAWYSWCVQKITGLFVLWKNYLFIRLH